MLKTCRIVDGKVTECTEPECTIMVFVAPDEAERRRLVDEYRLDEHTLGSALDPDELARLEFEPEHVAIIYKRPRNYSSGDGVLFKVTSTGFFLFRDRLIIVQPEDLQLFEGKQFTRVGSLNEVILKLIYRSIFHYLEHLKVMNLISVELEGKINKAMENRYLINLFGLEKSLTYYVSATASNGMLIEKLRATQAKLGFTTEELEFLDDITVENSQCQRQAEIYSNILASLMDARASIVSNNLNLLIKTLNIITIGLMVPTLVVSIFSMNVRLPVPGDAAPHWWPFWMIMGLAAASLVLFMFVWRRFWR
jgi:magnesium transporter